MSKPIIAVDIDEVLSASAPDFVAFSNERWGTHLEPEDYTEQWLEMWQVDEEEATKRRVAYFESGIVGKHQPMMDAHTALKTLSKDYDIVLVTSRSIQLESETRAWVETHYADTVSAIYFSGIYDSGLGISAFTKTKADVFAEIKPAIVIDDQLKHCEAATDLGIQTILFGTYRWNKDYEGSNPLLTRCNTWQEVLTFVRALD